MLMIAAQVAKGESQPGINRYIKEIKSIRDRAFFARMTTAQDRKLNPATKRDAHGRLLPAIKELHSMSQEDEKEIYTESMSLSSTYTSMV